PALPEPMAAELYAGLLADAFAAARDSAAGERLSYWADDPGAAPAGFLVRRQRGGDLGERLRSAFAELLRDESDRALVIGSDTPRLTAAQIDQALAALESHDAVLGPARDGGYWCVGLRRPAPELF